MPPEPKSKLKRRSSRRDTEEYKFDGGHSRELELKRSRGPQIVSCAECRRLKIKCDRQVPCTSCQRRGCAALCPNGSLATGQGTRFVLAATEHLHRRISRLSGRIRELENALANIHNKYAPDGDQPHPLLENDWLLEVEEGADDDELEPGSNRTGDVIDALGTLSISNHGISRFFGPTGGSESLLIVNSVFSSGTTLSSGSTRTIDPRITLFSHRFPFTPLALPSAQIQELIESYLPTYERAREVINIYFEQVAWIFRGVTREQLDGEMVGAIYARKYAKDRGEIVGEDYSGPHDLALLFMVFALGALLEPIPTASRPSPNALGEHYHQLAQAALSLQPVLEKPSIVTIQCLHVMSIYNAMSGEGTANPSSDTDSTGNTLTGESKTGQSETSMEMTWSLITMAAHLSQTIGLHRDSERWGLSPKMVQRRRILFWDLFVADVWQSLNTGRPPSFSLAYVDCSFPQYEGINMKDANSQGKPDNRSPSTKVEIWQFRFASECLAEVVSRTLLAEAPTYTTIMELDRMVREFPLPEGFGDRGAGSSAKEAGGVPNTFPTASKYANPPTAESECQDSDMSFSFMKCVLDHIRETAIIDQPTNPLKSVYAPSFLAAYRASAAILKSVREQFILWPNSCARFWTMWTFAFTAAVVFGTVVTRGPRSPLAASAMTELDQAWILFSKAAIYSKRATKALPILTTLREKARLALAAAQSKSTEKPLADGELWNIKKEEIDLNDELSIFAGHTRLVSATTVTSGTSEIPPAGVQITGPPGFILTPVASMNSSTTGLRQHRSSSQLRRQYHTDVDMEYDQMYDRNPSQSYQQHHSRHREDYDMHTQNNHPPTISIPPAPASSSIDERSPHQPMQFNYSYDRSSRSGPSPVATASTYSWSPHSPYPSRHSSSPVRLSHPQYGPSSSQMPSDTPMHSFHNPPPPAQIYSGPGVTGFAPPIPPHSLPMHPPGNAALADLGLASRDSRLDERWSSFMQDSGLLDEVNFSQGNR
ncbi:MAG: fungal-specific transcription factor domain-containing protein [Lentinula lateritia]|nr:MAG: fungal-specific transcription factor domain-containing protein [Lentinula lateritia]